MNISSYFESLKSSLGIDFPGSLVLIDILIFAAVVAGLVYVIKMRRRKRSNSSNEDQK